MELHQALTLYPRSHVDLSPTICTAESLTGGLVASLITETPGCSAYFHGGIVAYNLDQKVRLLHVDRVEAAKVNCVSATVAKQMAIGAQEHFRTTGAIATTGYADPGPLGVPEAWVCTIWGHQAQTFHVIGFKTDTRNDFRDFVARKAIEALTKQVSTRSDSHAHPG